MNLKQEINRTETNKNKTKQVATNIDNKLVELGGERATDLSDVANKMEGMVTGNYKKIATMKPNKTFNTQELTKGVSLSTQAEFTITDFIIKIGIYFHSDLLATMNIRKNNVFKFSLLYESNSRTYYDFDVKKVNNNGKNVELIVDMSKGSWYYDTTVKIEEIVLLG